ncbi:MAG: hypothetical protein ACKVPX_09475 [Myxococcaceae bacterium]
MSASTPPVTPPRTPQTMVNELYGPGTARVRIYPQEASALAVERTVKSLAGQVGFAIDDLHRDPQIPKVTFSAATGAALVSFLAQLQVKLDSLVPQ